MALCTAKALLQPVASPVCCACSCKKETSSHIAIKGIASGPLPFRAGLWGRPLTLLAGKGRETQSSASRFRIRAAGVEVETVEVAESAAVPEPVPTGGSANRYKSAPNKYANGKAANGSTMPSDDTITNEGEPYGADVKRAANGVATPSSEQPARKKKSLNSGRQAGEGSARAPPGPSKSSGAPPRAAWKRGDSKPKNEKPEAKDVWTPKAGKRVFGVTPSSDPPPAFDRPAPAAERPAVPRRTDPDPPAPPRRLPRAETPARSPAASAEVQVWRPGKGQSGGPEGGGRPPPGRGGAVGGFADQALDDPSMLSRRPPPRGGPPGAPGEKVGAKKRPARKTGAGRGRGEEDENQRFIADNQIVIPGMPQKRMVKRRRRKGRAYKARMRALRDKTGQPVRAEIIEVGEEGLAVSELAELLVVNEAEVVSALFMKGASRPVVIRIFCSYSGSS
jgi:hypothetical protein